VRALLQHPGFVRGYWRTDTDESGIAHAVVVLDSHTDAPLPCNVHSGAADVEVLSRRRS
jgi:hypothetical protein